MHRRAAGTAILCAVTWLAVSATAQTHGSVDTQFLVVLSYTDSPTAPGFIAALTTSSTYPCEGYRVTTHVTHSEDTLVVHIGGFVRPVPCIRSAAVAEGTAYLGPSLKGFDVLMLEYRGIRDLYRIMSLQSGVTLHPLDISFSETE